MAERFGFSRWALGRHGTAEGFFLLPCARAAAPLRPAAPTELRLAGGPLVGTAAEAFDIGSEEGGSQGTDIEAQFAALAADTTAAAGGLPWWLPTPPPAYPPPRPPLAPGYI